MVVLGLGIRHGFDLDHLATIDAITRSVKDNKRLSRMVGCLFSLGHGLIVILVSVVIGSGFVQGIMPDWLDGLGHWISIFFLMNFGLITLWSLYSSPESKNPLAGPKTFLFKSLFIKRSNPFVIIVIGALFALSFDTITQVALFSISAAALSSWLFSLLLGVIFMLGMMISDGLNGLLMSSLIQQADKKSIIISKMLGMAIGMFSLLLGIVILFEQVRI